MRARAPAWFLAACLCAVVAAAADRDAHGAPIWKADLETGDISQFTSYRVESVDRLQVLAAPNPVWAGQRALRIEIRKGDVGHPHHGHKIELDTSSCNGKSGADFHYSLRVFWPADYPAPLGVEKFFGLRGGDHEDPVRFDLTKDQKIAVSLSGRTVWSTAWARERWYDFALHVGFSFVATDGFLELWFDGAQVLPKTAGVTLAAGVTPRPEGWPVRPTIGIFPAVNDGPPRLFFFDEIVCGRSLAEVTVAKSGDGGAPSPLADAGATGSRDAAPAKRSDAGSSDAISPPTLATPPDATGSDPAPAGGTPKTGPAPGPTSAPAPDPDDSGTARAAGCELAGPASASTPAWLCAIGALAHIVRARRKRSA